MWLIFSTLVASETAGVNRKTANRYFNLIRQALFKYALQDQQGCNLKNRIELDESYVGSRRVSRKRGDGFRKKNHRARFTLKKLG